MKKLTKLCHSQKILFIVFVILPYEWVSIPDRIKFKSCFLQIGQINSVVENTT
jgi:hypothetical protein